MFCSIPPTRLVINILQIFGQNQFLAFPMDLMLLVSEFSCFKKHSSHSINVSPIAVLRYCQSSFDSSNELIISQINSEYLIANVTPSIVHSPGEIIGTHFIAKRTVRIYYDAQYGHINYRIFLQNDYNQNLNQEFELTQLKISADPPHFFSGRKMGDYGICRKLPLSSGNFGKLSSTSGKALGLGKFPKLPSDAGNFLYKFQ